MDRVIMDDKWFRDVRARLEEIEREKVGVNLPYTELYRHPALIASRFWKQSDNRANSGHFDWHPKTWPQGYLSYMSQSSRELIIGLAETGYTVPAESTSTKQENQKILTARLISLGLRNLIQV